MGVQANSIKYSEIGSALFLHTQQYKQKYHTWFKLLYDQRKWTENEYLNIAVHDNFIA